MPSRTDPAIAQRGRQPGFENRHHRCHPGDKAHHRGTGPEAFRLQEDRAVHDDLARQEVDENPEEALATFGESQPDGVINSRPVSEPQLPIGGQAA